VNGSLIAKKKKKKLPKRTERNKEQDEKDIYCVQSKEMMSLSQKRKEIRAKLQRKEIPK
jgi:hypothetical protein